MIPLRRCLFLILTVLMATTVASPALAARPASKPAPVVEWTVGSINARTQSATVGVGQPVNLLAKFPKACRGRNVVLKTDGVVVMEFNTGSMKSFEYSVAAHAPGATKYTFKMKRDATCAGVKSSFELEVR